MVLLIPVQQNSNCLHQQLKVLSCSRSVRCALVLCPRVCSVCPLYHKALWWNWTSLDLSPLICRWHSLRKSAPPYHVRELVLSMQECIHDVKCGCPAINWNWMMTKQKQWLCPLRECPRPYPCQNLLSRYFKCQVFSACQNSICDARYAADQEKPVCNSSRNCKLWTPTHQLHSSLSFCGSYTEVLS